jgi:hypothetical protein
MKLKLSPTQEFALGLARKHKGLKRFNGTIYWIGADIDDSSIKTARYSGYPENTETVGSHSVKALTRMGLLTMEDGVAKVVECGWCNNEDYNRFECSLINDNGHSLAANNMVITCIADYCPKCGRRLID